MEDDFDRNVQFLFTSIHSLILELKYSTGFIMHCS